MNETYSWKQMAKPMAIAAPINAIATAVSQEYASQVTDSTTLILSAGVGAHYGVGAVSFPIAYILCNKAWRNIKDHAITAAGTDYLVKLLTPATFIGIDSLLLANDCSPVTAGGIASIVTSTTYGTLASVCAPQVHSTSNVRFSDFLGLPRQTEISPKPCNH